MRERIPVRGRVADMLEEFCVKVRNAAACPVCGAKPCVCSVVEGFMDGSGPHVGARATRIEGGRLVAEEGLEA